MCRAAILEEKQAKFLKHHQINWLVSVLPLLKKYRFLVHLFCSVFITKHKNLFEQSIAQQLITILAVVLMFFPHANAKWQLLNNACSSVVTSAYRHIKFILTHTYIFPIVKCSSEWLVQVSSHQKAGETE